MVKKFFNWCRCLPVSYYLTICEYWWMFLYMSQLSSKQHLRDLSDYNQKLYYFYKKLQQKT